MTRTWILAVLLSATGIAQAQTPQVRGQLMQLNATLAPGQVPVTQVFASLAGENQEVPFMVPLEPGRCYTFIGTVGPGVQQLSIYLFDPTGKTVTKDTTDKSIAPKITHCAKWPGLYKILGKIKRGAGELAIQGFSYGSAAPPPQQPVVIPPPPPTAAPPPPPPPPPVAAPPPGPQSPLTGQLWSMAQTMAPGQRPASPAFPGVASEGQEVPFMVALQPGRCFTFLGTVAPSVQQLSIYLFDPTGRSVAKDTTDRSIAPRMTHCALFAGYYKLLGKVKRGSGEFAIQAFAP